MIKAAANDKIFLRGMEFWGYHGVIASEQELGQRFVIDVELSLDLTKAGISDNLADTVNYAAVYRLIRRQAEDNKCTLIERLADEIAACILAEFIAVDELSVTVHKPAAPIGGVIGDVGVTINRKRANSEG